MGLDHPYARARDPRGLEQRQASRKPERGSNTAGLRLVSVTAPVELRCPVCNAPRELKSVQARLVRSGKAPLAPCPDCRSHPKPTEGDRRWWLERFTIEECREMADAFWPRG